MSVSIKMNVKGAKEFSEALNRFDSEAQRQIQNKLAAWAESVKAEASRLVPVRTGYLKNSLYTRVQDWQVQIGARAPYAAAVERGTSNRGARPFLQPAVQKRLPDLERVLREALESAKTGAGL
ncbi:MAG: HK97 gp10 family phage protein [Candidatus Bathyarchaeota archaeon]|nr:HK97 gp10 family phage protein [Candidatus Bathyarchaeota archaeon]